MSKNDNHKTHWRDLHQTKYLTAGNLASDTDTLATIDRIEVEKIVNNDGRTENLPVAHFSEDIKPMVLNVTNCRTMEALTGSPHIQNWTGPIALHITKTKAFGEMVDTILIRPERPPLAEKPELKPGGEKWGDAVEALAIEKTTVDEIRKYYKLSIQNQRKLTEQASKRYEEVGSNSDTKQS